MGLLDRYLLRRIAPGALLGTGVFLFALLLNELIRHIRLLLGQGASPSTVGLALLQLVPGVSAVVVPSALLLGVLLALNSLSGGRELIAMRAGGVAPGRLLLPVGAASFVAFGLCALLMLEVVPHTNRRFIELSHELMNAQIRTEIEPRIFYDELLEGRVLLVRETPPGEDGWRQVFLADTRNRSEPTVFLAERGRLVASPEERVAFLELAGVEVHDTRLEDPDVYRIQRAGEIRLPLRATTLFGPEEASPYQSTRAMDLPELFMFWEATGHPAFRVEIHKKFALPAACLAFGLIGLGLGVRPSARPARAGAFALAVFVIFGYYFPFSYGEELALSEAVPPWLGIWGANILAFLAGLAALLLSARELDPLAPLTRLMAWIRRRLRTGGLERPRPRRSHRRRLPGLPTILDRYVVSQLAKYCLLALAGLIAVLTIERLVAVIGDAVERGLAGTPLARYLWFSLPEFGAQMLPLAALTATLITFGFLSRHSEVTAFLAGGVSLPRLALPALALGLLAGAAGHAIQETVVPVSGPATEDLGARIRGAPRRTLNPLAQHWRLGRRGEIYHYREFDASNAVLGGLSVFALDESGTRLQERRYATAAHWSDANASWTAIGGWSRDFTSDSGARPFALAPRFGVEAPAAFLGTELRPEHLAYRDLDARIAAVAAAGHDPTALVATLRTRESRPLAALVMVLIALPFAFRRTNQGGLASAAIAFGIGILFLIMSRFFGFLGQAELLDPTLAAWSPNLFFGLASIFLLLRRTAMDTGTGVRVPESSRPAPDLPRSAGAGKPLSRTEEQSGLRLRSGRHARPPAQARSHRGDSDAGEVAQHGNLPDRTREHPRSLADGGPGPEHAVLDDRPGSDPGSTEQHRPLDPGTRSDRGSRTELYRTVEPGVRMDRGTLSE